MFSFFQKSGKKQNFIQREVLSPKEIQEIVQKIKNQYKKYQKESPKIFKLSEFEKRYALNISSKGNTSLFLNEELKYFFELKKKYVQNQIKENQTTFYQIAQNFEKKFKKYLYIDFHPLAKKELKYFYGAIKELVENEFVLLKTMFGGTVEYYELKPWITIAEEVGISMGNFYPKKITNYINFLNSIKDKQKKNSLIEKETQIILKDVCLALKKITDNLKFYLLNHLIDKNSNMKNLNLTIQNLNDYLSLNSKQATQKIIEKMYQIIKDFRMDKIVNIP